MTPRPAPLPTAFDNASVDHVNCSKYNDAPAVLSYTAISLISALLFSRIAQTKSVCPFTNVPTVCRRFELANPDVCNRAVCPLRQLVLLVSVNGPLFDQ